MRLWVSYARNKLRVDTSNFYDEIDENLYTKEDENGRYRDDVAFYQSGRGGEVPNLRYYVQCPNGSLVILPGNIFPPEKKEGMSVPSATENDKRWRWSYKKLVHDRHLLVFKETKTSSLLDQDGNKSKYNIYVKSYLEEREEEGIKPRNFLTEKKFLNRRGTDYLKTLGLDFPYSKPKELIIHLLEKVHLPKDAIILDFFAGSGTTGEAVLELNQEENSQRKFILCTNNEGQIAEEVCYPRLEKIIKGYVKKNKTLKREKKRKIFRKLLSDKFT